MLDRVYVYIIYYEFFFNKVHGKSFVYYSMEVMNDKMTDVTV